MRHHIPEKIEQIVYIEDDAKVNRVEEILNGKLNHNHCKINELL